MARSLPSGGTKEKKCYYTYYRGKRHRLDPNKKKAEAQMGAANGQGGRQRRRPHGQAGLDQYLDWSEANHAETTHKRVRASILSFADSLPPGLIIANLEPHHLTSWLDKRRPKKITQEAIKYAAEQEAKAVAKKRKWKRPERHRSGSGSQGSCGLWRTIPATTLPATSWRPSTGRSVPISGSSAIRPWPGYRKPPKTPRILYLAPEQQEDLLSRIDDREFRDFLVVLLHTGMRPGEARVMEAKHVMLKEGVVRIPKELAKGKRKERRVLLDETVLEIIKPLVVKYPDGPILRNTHGRPWTKDAINCRFTRLKADLPYRATAYAMRHTFINEALRNGAPETAIAEVVGHEDKTMIQKVYGHPDLHPDLLDSVVKKANKRAAS